MARAGAIVARRPGPVNNFSTITARTSDAVLIVEGTRAHDQQTFEKASNALVMLASDYCGRTAEIVSWPF